MDGARAATASSAVRPARAKFSAAVAASSMPYLDAAAASFMALFSRSASSDVLAIVLLARAIVLSTSAKVCTPLVPIAASGTETAIVIDFPTDSIFPPMSFSLSPAATIFWTATSVILA